MPRVTDAYRENRRHEIAAAAARCVVRLGIGTTSMTDIIAESKLSAGAVYGHFDTKMDIILYAANELLAARLVELECLDKRFDRAESNGVVLSPRALLRSVLEVAVSSDNESAFSIQIMSQAFVDSDIAAVARRLMESSENIFASHVYRSARAAGRSHDDASTFAREFVPVLVTLAQGFMFQVKLDATIDQARLVDRIASVIPDSYDAA
jgi:AcrR family transcriptional regulator